MKRDIESSTLSSLQGYFNNFTGEIRSEIQASKTILQGNQAEISRHAAWMTEFKE